MKPEETILSVQSLSKVYEKDGEPLYALKDISFELKKGEILGVIGRNGAGKSTLLKVLSKITAPSSGEITYDGQLTSIIDIGTGFHADLSGEENIYLSAQLLGYSKKEIKALYDQIVDFSGLNDFMQMPVKHYSSGMYLRLAFSIAFNTNIDILLLDEVIAVGDNDFKRKCYEKIKELKKRGTAIVLVSHHLSIIAEQCDRCLLLDRGEIKSEGGPIEVVDRFYEMLDNNQNVKVDEDLLFDGSTFDSTIFLKPMPIKCHHVTIHNVKIDHEGVDKISTSSAIDFEFQCEKLSDVGSFQITMHITNIADIRVLIDSLSFRQEYDPTEFKERGMYHVKSRIPKDLLSAGVYKLGLMISENEQLVMEVESIAKFRVSAHGKVWDKGMGSVVRPKLEWNVDRT